MTRTCEVCGGDGVTQVIVPVCCNIPTKTGECCCNPVPGYEQEPCGNCGGEGFYPVDSED